MERANSCKFEVLYREHHAVVNRCVASLGLPYHIWPDILQDIWITADRRLEEVLAHPQPAAWLCTVARNHALHYKRHHARMKRKLDAASAEPIRTSDHPFRDRDAWDTLARLLEGCPLEQREAFLKIELYGMTAAEVAEELGISVNTVHSRLRLTRQRLRDSGSVLLTVLLALRTQSLREAPVSVESRLPTPSPRAAPPVKSGSASIVALAATLLLTPSAPSQPDEFVIARHTSARASAPATLESVHTRVVQIPWDARSDSAKTALPTIAPLPIERSLRAERSAGRPRPLRPATPPRAFHRDAPVDDDEALLIAAQEAKRSGRFHQALGFAQQHRQVYPASQLRAACEIFIATMLCQLGRDDEAREQVRAFAREFPENLVERGRLSQLRRECR